MKSGALHSLRGRLFAFLLALAGITALAVGGATYVSVRAEADELFDYHLRQMALSLRDQGRIGDDERDALANPEFDYVVQVWSVQGVTLYTSRPRGLTQALPPRAVLGYSQVRLAGEEWRLFAAATPLRVVQVAQPLAVRRRLATTAALRSVLPIAIAAPLVAMGLWWIIGLSLAPLQRVVQAARSRSADSLQALPEAGLPQELQPLVGAFNGLLARLAEAFETQRHFVADAAHELRTPLTALKLQVGLLQGTPAGASQDEAIAQLRAGVDRATHLVEQLLALARAEPGATAAPMSQVDLAEVARQAIADAEPLAARRGAAITLDATMPVRMRGDPQALRSAIRNLLDNAVKFGGRRVALTVQATEGEGWLVRVDDDGPGIPPGQRERLVDRFQRGETREVEGSGLGLAIVQAVARRHGATLTFGTAAQGGLRVDMRRGPIT
ncbi:ATP-binding protein [uncultured Piscinibacter sp.]|uniref:ATP-binding protein n=1 Tax=uncultured Piscinibacter sp. TaxID=1131835 RepID=UPI0026361748|nr:ATP-binding protein [uncultured Piscinibacter sp.]